MRSARPQSPPLLTLGRGRTCSTAHSWFVARPARANVFTSCDMLTRPWPETDSSRTEVTGTTLCFRIREIDCPRTECGRLGHSGGVEHPGAGCAGHKVNRSSSAVQLLSRGALPLVAAQSQHLQSLRGSSHMCAWARCPLTRTFISRCHRLKSTSKFEDFREKNGCAAKDLGGLSEALLEERASPANGGLGQMMGSSAFSL